MVSSLLVHVGSPRDEAGHDARELVKYVSAACVPAPEMMSGAGLVDEDIHLVDDGEVVAALHAGLRA